MEVTRFNFKDAKKEFLKHLKSADFLSFDLELTGIKSEERNKTDLPFENYLKAYNAANKYAVIQMGLCIFKAKLSPNLDKSSPAYLQKDVEFEAFPFTFYLFPRTYDGVLRKDVGLEISSIQFNVFKHKINWNKWLAQGVGFSDQEERQYFREMIFANKHRTPVQLTDKDRDHIEQKMEEFATWYNNNGTVKNDIHGILENDLDNDPKAFLIRDLPLPIKRGLRREISRADKSLFIQPIFNEETKTNDYKVLKLSEDAQKNLPKIRSKVKEIQYNDAIGFSFLWEKIKEKIQKDNIPVVGHDCLCDLTFWYSHLETNLNKDYLWFKNEIKQIFTGGIYDNKILSGAFEMDTKTLEAMHEELHETGEHCVSITDPRFDCFATKEHTAGKDAYMSGFSFLEFVRNLDVSTVLDLKGIVNISPNLLYHYDFGSVEKDYARNKRVCVLVLKEKEANLLRVKNGCIDKKGKPIQSKMFINKR